MIPKIIHYCWFGRGAKSELIEKCIKSWREIMPDYEIIEWNEDNFDVNLIPYTKEAYDNKRYAFVSDVARLHVIYHHGGIYLDTDVEVIRKFDDLLNQEAFFGFEDEKAVNSGLAFGAVKGNLLVKEMLADYNDVHFQLPNGDLNLTACPVRNTNVLLNYGLVQNNQTQKLGNVTIYSTEYFCPKDYLTGEINFTENTYSIHLYNASWHSKYEHKRQLIRQKYIRKYGKEKGQIVFDMKMQKKAKINRICYVLVRPKLIIDKIKRMIKG